MKAVAQKHPMGCGIACVAYIAGVSYKTILKLFPQEYAYTRGYYCRELVKALAKFNFVYTYKKVTPKTRKYLKKKNTIVFIAPSKRYPAGHYLVSTKKSWMNPWINYPSMNPAKAGFVNKLPGKPRWVLFPKG